MKLTLYVMFAVLLFSLIPACQTIDEMKEAQQMIQQTLDRFYEALEKKDWETASSLYLQNANISAIGPTSSDYYTYQRQIQLFWRDFLENKQELKIWRNDELHKINFTGDMGWISSIIRMQFKQDTIMVTNQYFFSAVLKKMMGTWSFVQTHLSLPREIVIKSDSLSYKSEIPRPDTSVSINKAAITQ